jgi:hypothetical protein
MREGSVAVQPCLCVRNQDRDRIAGRCHGCVGFEEKAARKELELARHARVQSDLFMCSLGVTYHRNSHHCSLLLRYVLQHHLLTGNKTMHAWKL